MKRATPKAFPPPAWSAARERIEGLLRLADDAPALVRRLVATGTGDWERSLRALAPLSEREAGLLKIAAEYMRVEREARARMLTRSLATIAWSVVRGGDPAEALRRAQRARAMLEGSATAVPPAPEAPWIVSAKSARSRVGKAHRGAESSRIDVTLIAKTARPVRRDTSEETTVARVYVLLAAGSVALQGNKGRAAADGPLGAVIAETRPKD